MTWTKSLPLERATGQTARALALWQMQQAGLLDLSRGNKGELARKLGVTRWTLDRTLEVLEESKALARELQLVLLSDERLAEMRNDPNMRMDEDQYQRVLEAAGLAA